MDQRKCRPHGSGSFSRLSTLSTLHLVMLIITCLSWSVLQTEAVPLSDEIPVDGGDEATGLPSMTTTISNLNVKDEVPLDEARLTGHTTTVSVPVDSKTIKDSDKKSVKQEVLEPKTTRPLVRVGLSSSPGQSFKTQTFFEDGLRSSPSSSESKHKFNAKDSPSLLYDDDEVTPLVLKSSSRSPVVPYTVTNEVVKSDASQDDLEFLCHHYYKDEFVVSAHVQEQGCRLECVLLKSSGVHGSGYFDTSVTKVHTINEGQSCDTEVEAYKCVNGTCIEPPETGKAIVTIINGTFERADEDSESDPYVKVYLDQKFLTKTKIVENKNNPVWMQSFVTPVITSDTQLGFIVFDKDSSGEELLLTEQTTVNLILALGLNATATCGPPGSPRGQICYSIQWHPLTPQAV